MAEAIAARMAAERGLGDLSFASAGTSAWDGAPASDGALLVGMERGLDLNRHRAQTLSSALVQEADLILVMSPHHRDRALVLGGDGKSHLLTDFSARSTEGRAVMDPFGGDLETYRLTFDELTAEITRVFERLQVERGSGGG
jgi:protein-tyrosine-phosphatase